MLSVLTILFLFEVKLEDNYYTKQNEEYFTFHHAYQCF